MQTNLSGLALKAWRDAAGDGLTAVRLLRDRTGLSLPQVTASIEAAAQQMGKRCNLRLYPALSADALEAFSRWQAEDEARLATHRAQRGVRKIRGAK